MFENWLQKSWLSKYIGAGASVRKRASDRNKSMRYQDWKASFIAMRLIMMIIVQKRILEFFLNQFHR